MADGRSLPVGGGGAALPWARHSNFNKLSPGPTWTRCRVPAPEAPPEASKISLHARSNAPDTMASCLAGD